MKPKPGPRTRRRRLLLTPWTAAAAVAILAVAAVVAIAAGNDASLDEVAVAPPVQTGEQNAMGMPVIETPGVATGTAGAGAVEVEAANWELGTVPLNTAVRPTWILRNTGTEAVTIGQPHPEVREGCCPGAVTVASRTIPPGGETTVSFELSMHSGMDGFHDIALHVPLTDGSSQEALTLGVTGDFRDA